jgi:hypothetical protein
VGLSETDGVFATCPYCGQVVPADVESRIRVWLHRHDAPGDWAPEPPPSCAGSGLFKIKGAE